jgi:TonB family protein
LNDWSDGARAVGRLSGVDLRMRENEFSPAQPSSRDAGWQAIELRAERGPITVNLNGRLASSADGLDGFTGYVALQSRRGDGIQFRNFVVERLPSTGNPFGKGALRATEPGVTLPRALKTAKPWYPKEPHDAWIQGIVGLELVVDATGRAGDVHVTRSLHPDLDEAAVASAREWEFAPGTVSGQAVPIIVTMEVSFRRTQ